MKKQRMIEILTAGCPVCESTVRLIEEAACPSCNVTPLDMRQDSVARRARELGVRSLPAVLIDGRLVDCCQGRGPDEVSLREAGLGRAIV